VPHVRVSAGGDDLLIGPRLHVARERCAEHAPAVAAQKASQNENDEPCHEHRELQRRRILQPAHERQRERGEVGEVHPEQDDAQRSGVLGVSRLRGLLGLADDSELGREGPHEHSPVDERVRPRKSEGLHIVNPTRAIANVLRPVKTSRCR
jgi:hypothetical protein